MNPTVLELQSGFDERMQALGQRFSYAATGDEFDAILLPVQPIDPQLELGTDWREMSTLEARRDGLPPITYAGIITQLFPFWSTDENPQVITWKCLRREDNPANFAVKFWVVKVAQHDATAFTIAELAPDA